MKPFERFRDHKHYPVRVILEDAGMVLAPFFLMLLAILWVSGLVN